jgi:plastocyanin
LARWAALAGASGLVLANASSDLDVVAVDLAPLIDAAAPNPSQFAVDVPWRAGPASHGRWAADGDRATWHYTVRVPGAVSLSFHAERVALPGGATLTIAGGGETHVLRPDHLTGRGLWSRIVRGDTLSLAASVPAGTEAGFVLDVASLQAGYRSLEPGGVDHPRVRRHAVGSDAETNATGGGCDENYACRATAANAASASSTVAILVRNLRQCTGTLLNDVPGSMRPWVLTARHCQAGSATSSDPTVGADTVVYWNATTACGSPLGSVFASSTATQRGVTTRVEQYDAWLVELNAAPADDDAFYSGWDASGTAFGGGWSVHHGSSLTRQYVQFFGGAAQGTRALGGGSQPVWLVNNEIGRVSSGASGASLFDPAGRAVGVLSRALVGTGGNGMCPAAPPSAPTATSWSAEYVRLAGLWDVASDATSTTGATTFRAVLDPQATGTLVRDGRRGPPGLIFGVTSSPLEVGQPALFQWTATRAETCVASGGGPGGTWPGSGLPTAGTRTATESVPGTYTYTLTCSSGGLSRAVTRTVEWRPASARLTLAGPTDPLTYVTEPVTLSWTSNQASCEVLRAPASANWAGTQPGTGTLTYTPPAAGQDVFELRCGALPNAADALVALNVREPTLDLVAPGRSPQLRIGTAQPLEWGAQARSCTTSGGAAGDGWAGRTGLSGFATVTATTAGPVTYTTICTAGARTLTRQVAIDWTNAAASAQLTTAAVQTIDGNTGPVVMPRPNVAWSSNVAPCTLRYAGPESGTIPIGTGAAGAIGDARRVIGRYTYTLTCGAGADVATATADVDWVAPAPQVSLQANAQYVYAGVYLAWNSNTQPCTASGGAPGDGWAGSRGTSGEFTARPSALGTYTYRLSCGPDGASTVATASATLVASPPPEIVSLFTGGPPTASAGGTLSLFWSTRNVAQCTASGGTAASGFAGTRPASGVFDLREPVAGTYDYTLVCANETGSATRSIRVTFTDPPRAAATLDASTSSVDAGAPFTLTWTSTAPATSCTASGGAPADGWAGPRPASGTATVAVATPGTYAYGLACGNSLLVQRSVTVVAPTPPSVSLDASATTIARGASSTLSWRATRASACTAAGGTAGDGWAGARPVEGSFTVTPAAVGTQTYTLTCGSGGTASQAARAIVVTAAPTASLSASPATITVGDSVTLTWTSSDAAPCTASDGAAGDGWPGAIGTGGSRTLTLPNAGTYTYTVACASGGVTARAQAQVTVNARAPGSGGGGGGGGGSFDWLALLALGVPAFARRWRAASARDATPPT